MAPLRSSTTSSLPLDKGDDNMTKKISGNRTPTIMKGASTKLGFLHRATFNNLEEASEEAQSELVVRAKMVCGSPVAAKSATTNLMRRLVGSQDELPREKWPDLLEHLETIWGLPKRFSKLFDAIVRKSMADYQLPKSLNLEELELVLVKLLRRARDGICGSKILRAQFVRRRHLHSVDEVYEHCGILGKGAYGSCTMMIHRTTKQQRVCKTVEKSASAIPQEELEHELQILERLDHPHIIRVFESFESEDRIHVLMEPAFGGDLKAYLQQNKGSAPAGGVRFDFMQQVMRQSFEALTYMHAASVIHRDIKPANMLLLTPPAESSPHVALGDFGLAEMFEPSERLSGLCRGTFPYMAPEVFSQELDFKSDVWSIGVCCWEMLTAERPFLGDNPMSIFSSVCLGPLPAFERLRSGGVAPVELCKSLLTRDVSLRPSAKDVLEFEWITLAAVGAAQNQKPGGMSDKLIALAKTATDTSPSYFLQIVMNCLASQVHVGALPKLNEIFRTLDRDGSGTLTLEEIAEGLQGAGIAEEQAKQLMAVLDVDGSEVVEYNEFLAGCMQLQRRFKEKFLLCAFEVFDLDSSGSLSRAELRAMLAGTGPLSEVLPDGKTVDQVLSAIDSDNNGTISFSEFKAYVLNSCGEDSPRRFSFLDGFPAMAHNPSLPLAGTKANCQSSDVTPTPSPLVASESYAEIKARFGVMPRKQVAPTKLDAYLAASHPEERAARVRSTLINNYIMTAHHTV